MSEFQKTIKEPVTLSGTGLHTGLEVELTFKPAPPNTGYVFRRVDLDGQPELQALAEYVVDTSRGTVIENNGCRVGTIEHSLAALKGMDIDNCFIEVNAPEAPILDGSSRYYVEAIEKVGIENQDENRVYYEISEPLRFSDDEKGIEILALPDDKFTINTLISYPSEFLNNQYATLNDLKDFKNEIAPCRTFVFLRELEFLQKNNLIKGGDLSNAIVIVDHEVKQDELDKLAELLQKPSVDVKKQGILNNVELNFDNEMARHKLLDIVGDLSLIGMPIKGRIIATRPGHWANTEFAKLIRKSIKKELSKSPAPTYNPGDVPVFDINQVKDLLPHRPPFLMVDKIISIESRTIVGVKNVTINEDFFRGHFPQEPVMPGVLLVEAMAQVGGILVLHKFEDPEKYSTYFLRIDNIKFRKKVVPGDTVIFKLSLVSDIRRGIANMRGEAFVGNNIVAEGELMAQVTKNK